MLTRPESIPLESKTEARIAAALASIEKLEQYIDDCEFVPATNQHRGQVILALFSKALTVGRAVCSLVRTGFPDEAFGMTRTLLDIHFTVRYISNNVELRAERFAMFFAKDHEGWRQIIPKYYPEMKTPETEITKALLSVAKNYKNPHEWSGELLKTKSLAIEPDTYEFDSTGRGITAEFDYEILYKYTSHFVHSTICALESHLVQRGDVFKIRGNWNPKAKTTLAVFNVISIIHKIFVCGFRALRYEAPEVILDELRVEMESY